MVSSLCSSKGALKCCTPKCYLASTLAVILLLSALGGGLTALFLRVEPKSATKTTGMSSSEPERFVKLSQSISSNTRTLLGHKRTIQEEKSGSLRNHQNGSLDVESFYIYGIMLGVSRRTDFFRVYIFRGVFSSR